MQLPKITVISIKFQIQKWEELDKGILPSSLCIQRIAFSENSSSSSENHIQSKRSVGTAWHRLCVWIEVVSYPLFHRNRVSLFPPQDCKGFTAFMRAGPSDCRRCSRPPVRPEGDVGARLNELIAEWRAGRWFQSRRKSLILTIIEYYLHLLELAITASWGARNYLRRKWQALDIYNAGKFANRLPLRSEPIIPGTESDLESENAESVYPPPSEDEELEQGTGSKWSEDGTSLAQATGARSPASEKSWVFSFSIINSTGTDCIFFSRNFKRVTQLHLAKGDGWKASVFSGYNFWGIKCRCNSFWGIPCSSFWGIPHKCKSSWFDHSSINATKGAIKSFARLAKTASLETGTKGPCSFKPSATESRTKGKGVQQTGFSYI